MKAFGCIIISTLAIFTLVPALGYEVQPLYGRGNFFDIFSSQSLITRFVNLSTRFSILQSTVNVLSSQLAALQTLVASIATQLLAVQNSIRCPSNVSGGKVIGNTCFTVTTTPTAFLDAQVACNANGGTLAQPLPLEGASENFYAALESIFPTQFATVEAATTNTGLFWIGYLKEEANVDLEFFAQDLAGNFVTFDPGNPFFANAPDNPEQGAAILNPGSTWEAWDATTALPFICQYTLVI